MWLALIVAMAASSVSAAVAYPEVVWPEPNQWLHALTSKWGPLTDPPGDFSGANGNPQLDVVNGPGGSAFAWTFDGERLFFRINLRASPLHDNSSLQSKHWMAYLNTVGANAVNDRFHSDYGVVLDASGIRTTYADISKAVTKDDVRFLTGFGATKSQDAVAPSASDPYRYIYPHEDHGYMVRVAEAKDVEQSGGQGVWYLEFFVPLSWLSVPNPEPGITAPDPVEPTTKIRIAIGTSTQGSNIEKDLAGLSNSFDIDFYYEFVALHTDPQSALTGSGYGVLRDTRDDTTDEGSGYWEPGEIILLQGYGWTTGDPVAAKIIGPGENDVVRWQGSLPVDSDGVVTDGGNDWVASWDTAADAHAGVYTVLAVDPSTDDEGYSFKDYFTITQFAGIDTLAPISELTAILDHAVLYPVAIQNTGNATDTFLASFNAPSSGWSWTLHQNNGGAPGPEVSQITLPQNGTAELLIKVTPGSGVAPGATERTTLTLTSQFDAGVQAQHSFDTLAVGDPEALILVSGDRQEDAPGATLAAPLWVRAIDAHGYGVPGVDVSFAIVTVPQGAAGQALSAASGTSDMQGNAQTSLTLGSLMGLYEVRAVSEGLDGSPITFSAFSWNGEPARIAWIGPDEADVGQVTPLSLEVRNAGGEPTIVRVPTTLTLSTSTEGSKPFFGDSAASVELETVGLAPGDASVALFFRETRSGPAVLTALRTGGEEVGSADHDIVLKAGPPTRLAFAVQPTDAEPYETLPPVVVQIQDQYGNDVPPVGEETIALAIDPSNEGALLGTVELLPDALGKATYVDLSVARFGVKTLRATSPGLMPAISAPFAIWGSYLKTSTYSVIPDAPVLRGAVLTYTARIENTGNAPTRALVAAAHVPLGATFSSADSSACEQLAGPAGGELTCEVGPIPAGGEALFSFDVRVDTSNPDGAELVGWAEIEDAWNRERRPEGGDLVTIVQAPVVKVTQEVWPTKQVAPGDTIYVTIRLTNTGSAPATDIVVRSAVPAGVHYESGSASSSSDVNVQFQREEGGAWFDTDVDDEGAPVPVVAIRWIVPELEALTGEATFEYRGFLP